MSASGLEPVTQDDDQDEEIETYVPERNIPGARQLHKTADALEELNRVLWELAKAVFIIVAMLLGMSFVVLAYYAVTFVSGGIL